MIVVGAESVRAAEASECAADQGQFARYHDLLFENQGAEDAGFPAEERLLGFAVELGLEPELFASCLASNRHLDKVARSTEQAIAIGVRGTPTVFVNAGSSRIP
jgi:protein-disulfide isomerase